jgi:hypothetical protein
VKAITPRTNALSAEQVSRLFLERERTYHHRPFDEFTVARLEQLILRARADGSAIDSGELADLERAQKLLNGMFSGDADRCAMYIDEFAQAFAEARAQERALLVPVMGSARQLIGAMNDSASEAVKAANINQAWHVLNNALEAK